MTAPRIAPFDFDDFADDAPVTDESDRETAAPTVEDLDAARREGFAAGQRQAMASVEQTRVEMSEKIALAFEQARDQYQETLGADRAALRALSREVLTRLADRLGAERIVDAADDLIAQLLGASIDRSPAVLYLSIDASIRFAEDFSNLLKRRAVDDFIAIDVDRALHAAECRLEWRGGAVAYNRDHIIASIDSLIAAAATRPPLTETDHDE
ncbi:MAG: hypothetical protein AAGJ87_07140 [Pseudomonadota bacterium]